MIFAVFSGIFPESWISAQKRDTMTILLKTSLVCVSCIQNTQIRGETIAKVFGKVDTFWTYQRGSKRGREGDQENPLTQGPLFPQEHNDTSILHHYFVS
jgi:hypothetical protein